MPEREAFELLSARLRQEGLSLCVVCVGGFVLNHHGIRATLDIDAFFAADDRTYAIIEEVGDELGINMGEPWLNNSVQRLNRAPDLGTCALLYDLPNLKVYEAPLDYVAGMKLESAREQDIQDVSAIIRKLRIASPDELERRLRGYGFPHADESLLLESFGLAYGMEWLAAYYRENERSINQRIRESW